MKEFLHQGWDLLSNSILITGLVLIMMLMIEYFNVFSHGKWFSRLRGSKFKQILVATCLGMIPGCIGGFATVSLYTHKLVSFGALVSMMIASSGDEAFVMMAIIPEKALLIFGILFILAIIVGVLTDYIFKKRETDTGHNCCDEDIEYHSHNSDCETPSIFKASSYAPMRHPSAKRLIIMTCIALFICAVVCGIFTCGHDHGSGADNHHHSGETVEQMWHECQDECCTEALLAHELHDHDNAGNHEGFRFNILDEQWINVLFALLSIVTLFFTATAKEHFIEDHIWHHLIKHHALSIFLWTFGTLAICQIGLQFLDINRWISDNMLIVLIFAILIGIIPESGPHIIFITLFAQGIIPFYVLLVNSIVQDGHSTLPLLAHNKIDFLAAKGINVAVGIITGGICYIFL